MKKISMILAVILMLTAAMSVLSVSVFADDAAVAPAAEDAAVTETAEDGEATVLSTKALAAGIAILGAAGAGAIAMAFAVSKSVEGIARQPEANGEIRSTMMMGLVFIETAIIYALIVAILIIFVL